MNALPPLKDLSFDEKVEAYNDDPFLEYAFAGTRSTAMILSDLADGIQDTTDEAGNPLAFYTTAPHGMFAQFVECEEDETYTTLPADFEITASEAGRLPIEVAPPGQWTLYIHCEAENLAGFDIPSLASGRLPYGDGEIPCTVWVAQRPAGEPQTNEYWSCTINGEPAPDAVRKTHTYQPLEACEPYEIDCLLVQWVSEVRDVQYLGYPEESGRRIYHRGYICKTDDEKALAHARRLAAERSTIN